jgi:predicted peroxiredoxin
MTKRGTKVSYGMTKIIAAADKTETIFWMLQGIFLVKQEADCEIEKVQDCVSSA